MISSEEAINLITKESIVLSTEEIPLLSATNRILAEDLYADQDFPPYNQVRMDGIAICFGTFATGKRKFKIEKTCGAGEPIYTLQNGENCVEIMTGSVLPIGTDTVIRYEDLNLTEMHAVVNISDIIKGQNIQKKGDTRKRGELIIAKGKRISSAEIGVAATLGKSTITVAKPPKIALISSGNELIAINQVPLPHQKRRSNIPALASQISSLYAKTDQYHLPDNKSLILSEISRIITEYQVVIMSGGVSMGKYDYIPSVLEELGIKQIFHKVAQRPGKPFWFGKHPRNNAIVFAFPGNPVSTFVGVEIYLKPWLMQQLSCSSQAPKYAVLTKNVVFKPKLTHFLQVSVSYSNEGKILATPIEGKGSGDHANLLDVDGFLTLSAHKDVFFKGEVLPLTLFRT